MSKVVDPLIRCDPCHTDTSMDQRGWFGGSLTSSLNGWGAPAEIRRPSNALPGVETPDQSGQSYDDRGTDNRRSVE